MKINRTVLLDEIINFFQTDSGVVIGDPGVGKSYLLSEIVSQLLSDNIPSTMIRLDYLFDGTDKEISDSLGIENGNWISALKKINIPTGKRGIIIFDAFDTIKEEALKGRMIRQIEKAKRELSNWSIVASVRTYDASRSQKLIDIFQSPNSDRNLNCRSFEIPILSEEEMQTIISNNVILGTIYSESSEKFKSILRIPFYLSLLDTILIKTETPIENFKALKSEIELLDMFWSKVVHKVESPTRTDLFLRNLTLEMVKTRLLSVDKFEFLSTQSDKAVETIDHLLTENVLSEQDKFATRISYSHNILFDFAVSKLILKKSAKLLLEFINEDNTRPFFLRPSFVYFFARLWYEDQKNFWSIYNELSRSSDNVILLFTKLIPSTVIAKEYEENDQLEFLELKDSLQKLQLQNVLQALRFIKRNSNQESLASFLLEVSKNLDLNYVWDFTILLESFIGKYEVDENSAVFIKCGMAARNLLHFLMENRSNYNVDRLASYRGVRLIAKTFSTDKVASKACLKNILGILSEHEFNISYFSTLSESLRYFWASDPEFGCEVYFKIFTHQEDSREQSPLHKTVLMNISMNRHDQYSTCRHHLLELFPQIIKSHYENVIPLGLSIVNEYIRNKNQNGFKNLDKLTLPKEFTINGVTSTYEVDMSHFWSAFSTSSNKSLEHSALIISYLEDLIKLGDFIKLDQVIILYFEHAKTAFNWNTFLEFGIRYPEILHRSLLEVIVQPSVLFWDDTSLSTGRFIEVAAKYYNNDELYRIENAILSLSSFVTEDVGKDVDTIIHRLISKIPRERLVNKECIEIIENLTPPIDPVLNITTTFEPYTFENYMSESGIDVDNDIYKKLLEKNEILRLFSQNFANGPAPQNVLIPNLNIAIEVFDEILCKDQKNDQPLLQALYTSCMATCEIIVRSLTYDNYTSIPDDALSKIKEITTFCLNYPTDLDSFEEDNDYASSITVPTPRSISASALINIFYLTQDNDLLNQICTLANDTNAIVRRGIFNFLEALYVKQNDIFWGILENGLRNEMSEVNKTLLISKLDRKMIFANQGNKLVNALQIAKQGIINGSDSTNLFVQQYCLIGLSYLRVTNNLELNNLLLDCLKQNTKIGATLIIQGFKVIEPSNNFRNYSDKIDVELNSNILNFFINCLNYIEVEFLNFNDNAKQPDNTEKYFQILDTVIQQTYYSLEINKIIYSSGENISQEVKAIFYFFIKPLLEKILKISAKLDGGFIQGHTAHYFIGILSEVLDYDTKFSLWSISKITQMAIATNYSFETSAVEKIVTYTESLLANHKELLTDSEALHQIMRILGTYANSGWPEALDLLWKLDDIFR